MIGFAISFYRDQLGAEATTGRADQVVGALDTCLTTLEYVDRNANLAMAIHHWSEQLADPLGCELGVAAW